MPYLFNCYTIFKVNKMECMIYMCKLAKYTLFDRAKYYYTQMSKFKIVPITTVSPR